MKAKRLPKASQIGASAQSPDEGQGTIKESNAEDLLRRLGAPPGSTALLPPASDGDAAAVSSELATSTEGRWNAALGCKTSEVALMILAQVTALEHTKHTDSDGVSVYGLGRFPVTLYKEQWTKLLTMVDEIRAFIKEHDAELKAKPDS